MPPVRRSRSLPPPAPDASGAGVIVALAALIALAIAFAATDGRLIDLAASAGRGPNAAVLGAVGAPGRPSSSPSAPAAGSLGPSIAPSVAPSVTPSVTPTPAPTPTRSPAPVRKPTTVNLFANANPRTIFVSEVTDKLCAAAAVQMTVEIVTGRTDRSDRTQRRIHDLEVELTTRADSRNGGTGPLGMAATISRLSGVKYELRIARTRSGALRDAAATLARTRRPVVLMAWRGAHAWVMTGFRADADPRHFRDARIKGAYILDPWYPRVSSIWGPSDPPNAYQNGAEMLRNYLPWKRPEGKYPGRDGRFLYLAPVERGG
ncbi:MAG TPA: hypothetical protein VFS32_13670 [Candidatus Limnocylindrales bacterium]|nr:hypothetical protein [Candidatus Limnocylindrales bacterium]